MIESVQKASSEMIQKGFLGSVVLGLALVLAGRSLVPTASLLGAAGAGLILVLYGLAGYFGFPRIRPEICIPAAAFGLVAGAIFAAEILLEYAVLPKDNTRWGMIEFGAVFGVYWLSSLVVAYRSRSARSGILAAIVSALFSSLIWLIFVLLMLYLFRGTARLDQVLKAEGTYEDFARSGMSDFNTFVMEDYYGAAFFHLLLGPIAAVILGAIGGAIGKLAARKFAHSEN